MYFKIYKSYNEIEWLKFEQFLVRMRYANFFQSKPFMDFLNRLENFQPVLICCYNNHDVIVGVLLCVIHKNSSPVRNYFSRRGIVYGGPVIDFEKLNKSQIAFGLLNELIKNVSSDCIYFEFRNLADLEMYKDVFRLKDFEYHKHLNIIIDTTNADRLKNQISSSRLRQIKKGLSSGAFIEKADNENDVKQFYLILQELYKTKVQKPLPEWNFFKYFFDNQDHLGVILLVKYDNRVIGGILCPVHKNKEIYEWYICGLDKDYKNQYPSVLATWAAIDYACKNNIERFNFLGAGSPDADYGVRNFKSKFGGEMVEYGRYIRINNQWLYRIGKLAIKFYKYIN